MKTEELGREIAKANRRMVELRRAARAERAPEWSASALAELSCALEELKVAEEELVSQNADLAEAGAESEFERQRYWELFMSSPYGQLVTDLGGIIREGNRAAAELLGVPVAELAGRSLARAIAPGDRDRFVRWFGALAAAAHDASVCAECGGSGEFQGQTSAADRSFAVEITAAPVIDRSGRIESIRWCLRDMSDREQARNAQRLAEEARRKDEFLAVLGHELRNPLAAITLASGILTAPASDATAKRWAAEVVKRHADQLRRLVDDLRDVSQLSRGKIGLQVTPVDLRDVLAAAVESCQGTLQSRRHDVSMSVSDQPVEVRGDGGRLRQVMANLVDNAGKYTPSGGRIDIALRQDGGWAILEVSDNGIGIAPAMLERIFGQYEQVEGAAGLREGGLGLGLSLVRQLVALHGGTVEASSDGEGKGSMFRVKLPIAGGARPPRPSPPTRDAPTAHNGHRVLIVDDNADAAELLAERLRQAGYAVDLAFDGTSGVASARQTRCHVALIDLGLPDLDGFEVCRALKGEQPGLRAVALTGYSDARSRDRAREAGFDHFLVKPLEPGDVMVTLAELVGPRQP